MARPEWKDAPEWARFLAQDRNGAWWWFELRPHPLDFGWLGRGKIQAVYAPSVTFKSSLEERP